MNNIWRFTGPPENWITGFSKKKWALNEKDRGLWLNQIQPGDAVIFHSTKSSAFNPQAISCVIGYGFVDAELRQKDDLWWVEEVSRQQNIWPYVVPLKEIYCFSNISSIDLITPVHEKSKENLKSEIQTLLSGGLSIAVLQEQARKADPACPAFPDQGSASRINFIYSEIILNQISEFFAVNESQSFEALDQALTEGIDEKLSKMDPRLLLADALAFNNTEHASHVMVHGVKKIRKENYVQKRRIAALESFSCQICGFKHEYTKKSGKPGWIIDVDHIVDKAKDGMEAAENLWVLCPNCHRMKTCGSIVIDANTKVVTVKGERVTLHHDHHLKITDSEGRA